MILARGKGAPITWTPSHLDSAPNNSHPLLEVFGSVGGAQMDYIVGRDGRFIGVREIEAPGDAAALRKSRQCVDGRDVEIWQRERRIGQISADQNNQSPIARLALRRLSQREKSES